MTRDRLLGAARADLVALPALVEERDKARGERPTTTSAATTQSRRLTRAPVDPRASTSSTPPQTRTGQAKTPASAPSATATASPPPSRPGPGSLCEELGPERPELTEVRHRAQSECAVLRRGVVVHHRAAVGGRAGRGRCTTPRRPRRGPHLGIRPEYRPSCRKCGSTVIPVDADRKLTSWEAAAFGACTGCEWTYPTGPALIALGQTQPPLPLSDIAGIVGIPVKTLHRWFTDGLITPATNGQKRNRLFDLAAVREVATGYALLI